MQQFVDDYLHALSDYLACHGSKPARVEELGEQASSTGLSAFAIMGIHLKAVQCLPYQFHSRSKQERIELVSTFLRESLKSYEAANAQRIRNDCTLIRFNQALEIQSKRMAQALHDDAGQLLTVAFIKLAKAGQEASPECAAQLGELRTMLNGVEKHLRQFSHELKPMALRDFGLMSAVELLIEGVSERSGLKISLHCADSLILPNSLETVLYRFVQEALTNIVRHAQANTVTIQFIQTMDQLTCKVVDDGVGFAVDKATLGMGLAGMHQRVEAVHGKLLLASNPGLGSELRIEIPLQPLGSEKIAVAAVPEQLQPLLAEHSYADVSKRYVNAAARTLYRICNKRMYQRLRTRVS